MASSFFASADGQPIGSGIMYLVTTLVLPGFLGVVTLIVAIGSWQVARGSLRLSRTIAEEQAASATRQARLDIADRVMSWIGLRWRAEPSGRLDPAARHAELGRISIALTESHLAGSGMLQELLWQTDRIRLPDTVKGPTRDLAEVYLSGVCAAATERAVIAWLRTPDAMSGLVPDLLEGVKKFAEEAESRAAELLDRAVAGVQPGIEPGELPGVDGDGS